ncbi:DUF4258 domain-containing protein [Thiolapillus sp.]|uniref:DUF4258 domain-containing protein n=1 Tax=Thiolapillus sp. TaxID=2017437 RepID=UPI0025E27325|nr:DUF4258 domain-containing protein [Thiolapillus sp.]
MNEFFEKVRALVSTGEVLISEHGYDELAEDSLSAREVLDGIVNAAVVEEYPNYPKGSCVLLLQKDKSGAPIHVVWGIPKGHDKPAVLITAYRPDPERWDKSFTRRR